MKCIHCKKSAAPGCYLPTVAGEVVPRNYPFKIDGPAAACKTCVDDHAIGLHPFRLLDRPAGMLLDDKTAVVTEAAFKALHEYSCSNPTGVFVGKVWKRQVSPREWLLGEYTPHSTDPNLACTIWRKLEVVK